MFKKIFLFLIILGFSIFNSSFFDTTYAKCTYTENSTLSSFLDDCKPKKLAGTASGSYTVERGLKDLVNGWIGNISILLGVISVGSLVYAGLLMQFSAGEDEKIKKSKNIIKWTLIGFLGLISASSIIYVVVNLIYSLA